MISNNREEKIDKFLGKLILAKNYESKLSGGHPNSLGKTLEVVDEILSDKEKFQDLLNTYYSTDAIVRLRVSNAVKRVCRVLPDLVYNNLNFFFDVASKINQASTKWTLAQIFMILDKKLTKTEKAKAKSILKNNLENEKDWIVLNFTMECLTIWAKEDLELKNWLVPFLEKIKTDSRKSVRERGRKYFEVLNSSNV